jgi:hypothetical protein
MLRVPFDFTRHRDNVRGHGRFEPPVPNRRAAPLRVRAKLLYLYFADVVTRSHA